MFSYLLRRYSFLFYRGKVLQFSEITPGLAFTEFDFYKDYEESFKQSVVALLYFGAKQRLYVLLFVVADLLTLVYGHHARAFSRF